MELFLDSSNPEEILEARGWGILSGVTTNPCLIPKGGAEHAEDAARDAGGLSGPRLRPGGGLA